MVEDFKRQRVLSVDKLEFILYLTFNKWLFVCVGLRGDSKAIDLKGNMLVYLLASCDNSDAIEMLDFFDGVVVSAEINRDVDLSPFKSARQAVDTNKAAVSMAARLCLQEHIIIHLFKAIFTISSEKINIDPKRLHPNLKNLGTRFQAFVKPLAYYEVKTNSQQIWSKLCLIFTIILSINY